MSIIISNITKVYGKQKALDRVSFEIKAGEIVGLVGPNGAGKSTLMKIITCYIPPTEGEVKVCGFDVLEESIEIRRRVGYLPENTPLYLDMYVKEYLSFIAGIHHLKSDKTKRIAEIIETTGLQLEQKKKIGQLSKGYRQRVGLAQALIHDPEVLILDEPTSGLDPNQLIEIRNLIKEIGKQKTILFSTHIMQEVEAVCSKTIVINKGKIVANKTTDELHKNTSSKNIIHVEFDTTVNKNLIQKIKGVENAINTKENIWEITTPANIDLRSDIFEFAVSQKIKVLSMQKDEKTLEEVFQQLTKN